MSKMDRSVCWDAAALGRPYPLVLLDARMPDTDGLVPIGAEQGFDVFAACLLRPRWARTSRSVCRTNGLRNFDHQTFAESSVAFPCFSWEFSVAAVVGASRKQAKRCSH
ncbi:MAG TPA: hypothetical protein VK395_30540 [Gemmataceae bacterium]|nr:hypothetical protein [Gemmataceae bacterium]